MIQSVMKGVGRGSKGEREVKTNWGREWKKLRLRFQVGKTLYLRVKK
jgi:hypothetical protein